MNVYCHIHSSCPRQATIQKPERFVPPLQYLALPNYDKLIHPMYIFQSRYTNSIKIEITNLRKFAIICI